MLPALHMLILLLLGRKGRLTFDILNPFLPRTHLPEGYDPRSRHHRLCEARWHCLMTLFTHYTKQRHSLEVTALHSQLSQL